MNWNDLSIQERATIRALAAQNGIYNKQDIADWYNRILEQLIQDALTRALIIDYVENRFPASIALDYIPYHDSDFTPKKDLGDDFGNIAYMKGIHDDLPYYNNYRKPNNLRGKSVIVYNDDVYDINEAVALDAITHGLREQDDYWRNNILPKLSNAWYKADPWHGAKEAYYRDVEKNGLENAESFDKHYDDYVDAAIRSLLVDPNSPEVQGYRIKDNKYLLESDELRKAWQEAYDYIMNNDKHILSELIVTPNQYGGGGRKKGASKYNKQTFDADYNAAWGNTRYMDPAWRAYWTKMALLESAFNPIITNSIGAKGYFQLMPFNRAKKWTDNLQLFKEADRLLRSFESSITEKDLLKAAKMGIDKYGLLAGAWLGGIGGMRAALNGNNRADGNGTTVLDRMRNFSNLAVMQPTNFAEQYAYNPDEYNIPLNIEIEDIPTDLMDKIEAKESPAQYLMGKDNSESAPNLVKALFYQAISNPVTYETPKEQATTKILDRLKAMGLYDNKISQIVNSTPSYKKYFGEGGDTSDEENYVDVFPDVELTVYPTKESWRRIAAKRMLELEYPITNFIGAKDISSKDAESMTNYDWNAGLLDKIRNSYYNGATFKAPHNCILNASTAVSLGRSKLARNSSLIVDPSKYGYEEIPLGIAGAGDLVQYINYKTGRPFHAGVITNKDGNSFSVRSSDGGVNMNPVRVYDDNNKFVDALKGIISYPKVYRYTFPEWKEGVHFEPKLHSYGGHIYDGTTESTQLMNTDKVDVALRPMGDWFDKSKYSKITTPALNGIYALDITDNKNVSIYVDPKTFLPVDRSIIDSGNYNVVGTIEPEKIGTKLFKVATPGGGMELIRARDLEQAMFISGIKHRGLKDASENFLNELPFWGLTGGRGLLNKGLSMLAPGTTGGNLIGTMAGSMALGESADLTSKVITGKTLGENVREAIQLSTGFNGFSNPYANYGYNLFTDLVSNPFYVVDPTKSLGKVFSSADELYNMYKTFRSTRRSPLVVENTNIGKTISPTDYSTWTDEMWDNAYNETLKTNDTQRLLELRDAHFKAKAPDAFIDNHGNPQIWYHGSPYAGHSKFNSKVFNATIGGESTTGNKGNFFTSDYTAALNYAGGHLPYTEYPEYTFPLNFKEKLLNLVGKYKPQYIHPATRGTIDVKKLYSHDDKSVLQLMDLKNPDGTSIFLNSKIYATYINPGKTYTVDFEGNPWSNSPIEFPKYYFIELTTPRAIDKPFRDKMFSLNKEVWTSPIFYDYNLALLEYNSRRLLSDLSEFYSASLGSQIGKALQASYNPWNILLDSSVISPYMNYQQWNILHEKLGFPGKKIGIFEMGYPRTTNGAVLYAGDNGYNSILLKNVQDANTGPYPNYPIDELVPLQSSLIKLANPITYDDLGNIIPLSKRDNFGSPDIRYSIDTSGTPDYSGDTSMLKKLLTSSTEDNVVEPISMEVKRGAVDRMLEYFGSPEYAERLKASGIPYTQEQILEALLSRINNNGYFPGNWVSDITEARNISEGKILGMSDSAKGISLNKKYSDIMDINLVIDHELAHYSTYNIGVDSESDFFNALMAPTKYADMWSQVADFNNSVFRQARTDELILKDFGIEGKEALEAFLKKVNPDYLRSSQEIRSRLYSLEQKAKLLGMTLDELVDKYTYDGFIDNIPKDLFQLEQLGYLFTPQLIKNISKKYLSLVPLTIVGGAAYGATNGLEYKLGGILGNKFGHGGNLFAGGSYMSEEGNNLKGVYGKDITNIKGPVLFILPDNSTKTFKNSKQAQAYFDENYSDKIMVSPGYNPTLGTSKQPIELPEPIATPNTTSTTSRVGIDYLQGRNYSPGFESKMNEMGMNPVNWTKHIDPSYWDSDTHKNIVEGNKIAAGTIAAALAPTYMEYLSAGSLFPEIAETFGAGIKGQALAGVAGNIIDRVLMTSGAIDGVKREYNTVSNAIKNKDWTLEDTGNAALGLFEIAPAVTTLPKDISYLGDNLRRRIYHKIDPFGYKNATDRIKSVLDSYIEEPTWWDSSNIPNYYNKQVHHYDVDRAQRAIAFRKALRLEPSYEELSSAPYLYAENPNGTYRLVRNPNYKPKHEFFDPYEHSEDRYNCLYYNLKSNFKPWHLDDLGRRFIVIKDPYPGSPGGNVRVYPDLNIIWDKWDIHPFENINKLPKSLRFLKNVDLIKAVGGDPFVTEYPLYPETYK